VLVHNALTVHYSEANTAPTSRCTWYLEFRTRPALRSESPWDETWINQRRSMLFRAAAERERAGDEARWPPLATGESREQWCRDTSALRTPHVTGDIDYDLESPYHHFA
jgi:hypothetical protein